MKEKKGPHSQAIALLNEFLFKGLYTTIYKTKHILDLDPLFATLRDKLKSLADDPSPFMRGRVHLFGPSLAPRPSLLRERALETGTNEEGLARYLKYAFHAGLVCLGRVKPDFLEGGEFANGADLQLQKRTASVPTTNRRNEGTFGKVDNTMRDSRRMRVINMAAQIKAQQNGTAKWLAGRQHRKQITGVGRKMGRVLLRRERKRAAEGKAKQAE